MKAALVCLLVLSACCQIPRHNYNTEAASVVQVVDSDGDGMCTAFYLGDGLWGTAAHCAPGAASVDGLPLLNKIVSETDDVAILVTIRTNRPRLTLGSLPAFGTEVHYIGFPWYGSDYHFGVYSGHWGKKYEDAETQGYEFSGFVDGGASGSPLLDPNGHVVGVVVASYRRTPYSAVEPVSALRALLESAKL